MARVSFQNLQENVSKIDKNLLYKKIYINIKKYRLEKFYEFKTFEKRTSINPYSTENIDALLDYNHNQYKRFKSINDSIKRIPLDKLIKLSIILDKKLNDFIKLKTFF